MRAFRILVCVAIAACSDGTGEPGFSGQAIEIITGPSGSSSCALQADGAVYCWGNITPLMLGPFNGDDCPAPYVGGSMTCANPWAAKAHVDPAFVEIAGTAAGLYTTCGRTQDGHVYCWPIVDATTCPANTYSDCGQLLDISNNHTYVQLATGLHGAIGLTDDGHVYFWRDPSGTFAAAQPPVELGSGHTWRHVWGGWSTWSGVDDTGAIWEGKLNTPDMVQQTGSGTYAAAYEGPDGGGNFTGCALTTDGHVACWGFNAFGALGDGSPTAGYRADPEPIASTSTYVQLAIGANYACAVTTAGGLDCWGWNGYGQLGTTASDTCTDPGTPSITWPCTNTPVSVPLPMSVKAVSAGASYTCALLVDQSVWCWGANDSGQLGRGTISIFETTPAQLHTSP